MYPIIISKRGDAMRCCSFVFLSLLFFLFFGEKNAYAYLDPGSAGLLYQIGYLVIGAIFAWFAGFGRFLKVSMFKLKGKSLNKDIKK